MRISKCTSLFLALLILVSNVGLAFNVHYCGGNIAGISFNIPEKSNQQDQFAEEGCCSAKEGKTCCDDKVIKIQEKSDVVVKTFSFQIDAPFVAPPNWHSAVFVAQPKITNAQTQSYYCDAHAPPLYRLYSQYIFYA